eukprot:526609_1
MTSATTTDMKHDDTIPSTVLNELIPNKSPNDPREYKIITLSNDLECILVSDPDTEKAACAMCVRVGHFADPQALPGLAHFLEHMLFLGTKKYPNEAEYKQFLKDHGGSSNASTGMHDTCYQFDVASEYLEEAIDRFAQFFIDPLFTESATDRELNAVNSENSNNEQSDPHRLYQLDKSFALATHPFHKFGTGNIKTLKEDVDASIDVRNELLKFHKTYYSSSIMKLAIVGKESIDSLQKMVMNTFSGIANTKRSRPVYESFPRVFDLSKNPILYKVVPIKERRELRLSWLMPSCYELTRTNPTSLLSYCLGDESKGSVLSLLKHKGYATGLMAGLGYSLPEFALMRVTVYLTPQGLENWNEIVSIIYEYIACMRQLSEKQWHTYFIERSKVRQMNFNFKGKEKPYGYARSLASNLQRNYTRHNFLELHGGLLFEYSFDEIKEFLQRLTVDNCYYQLVGKEFEDECKEIEPWYQTMHKTEAMDANVLNEWRESKNDDDALFTPLENPYIADDFTLCCEGPSLPYVVRETEQSKIWFKMDETFKKPKLCVSIRLYSPFFNDSTLSICLTNLVILILNDELSDSTYVFEEASMSFDASFHGGNAIQLAFGGYNQKLSKLMETVLAKFSDLRISKDKYEINKEKYHRSIVSMRKSQPYLHCNLIDNLFLSPKTVYLHDLEAAEKDITYENVCAQYKKIFDKLYIESFIYGNISTRHSDIGPLYSLIDKYLVQAMKETYSIRELAADRSGCLILEPNRRYLVSFQCPNEEDKNSAISTTYLYKVDTVADYAVLALFAHMIDAPCFDSLRTKQQLGYIVFSFADFYKGFMSFRILIQSNCANPNKLNCRIEAFLNSFAQFLVEMEDATFELNKKSLINNLLEASKTVYEQNSKYWSEISKARYQFERRQNIANEVEKVSKSDVIKFYHDFIEGNAAQKSKLTVQCYGNQHDPKRLEETEEDD